MQADQAILRKLIARGVTPLPPAGAAAWARLQRCCGFAPGVDFKIVSAQFDGFLIHDPQSMMMLWSIDQMITRHNAVTPDGEWDVVIGDFMIEADYIVATIADHQAPVRLLHEERDLAPSLQQFVSRLAAGTFDWLT